MPVSSSSAGRHLTAGIDVGSSAVKVCIARSDAGGAAELLSLRQQRIRRRNVREVAAATLGEALREAGVAPTDFDYICSTGDADAVDAATGHFYGMTTHARGALQLDPEARALIDVGALHARAIRINGVGRVLQHRMTSQCASGSGQFLENIARYLGVPLDDVGALSAKASAPEECSSICAVLAETDVINMVSRGIATGDILKGIHLSIARRLAKLLRATKAEGVVLVTGGLAHDEGLVAALNDVLDEEQNKKARRTSDVTLRTHPEAIFAGAIGAALLGAQRHQQLADRGVELTQVGAL
jgi:benzoyl-CoA reductase subunit D